MKRVGRQHGWLRLLPFSLREETTRSAWSIVLPLCVFLPLVGLLTAKHEPWADEAQAWQLARFTSIPTLFKEWLHLEMTPGLWHSLLRAESAAGLSYAGMHWITAGIGSAAVLLLLWRSPFPAWIRVSLPFTYFIAYQYPIVARSYSLAPLLFFALASQWLHRRAHPFRIVLLLALLANVCAQTLVVAMGFGLVLAVEWWRRRSELSVRRGPALAAGMLLCAGLCFAAWCCQPPPNAPWVVAAHAWKNAGNAGTVGMDASPWRHSLAMLRVVMKYRDLTLRTALFGGLASRQLFALPLWCATVILLLRQRRLRYLWPVALLAFFGTFTRFSFYHQGIMWLLLLNLLWISWPVKADTFYRFLQAGLALCVVTQLLWSARVMRREFYEPYAPSAAAAPVLANYLSHGREVDVAMPPTPLAAETPPAFFAVGLQPYFAAQPFANLSYRYWSWVGDPGARERYLASTEGRRAVAMIVEYQGKEAEDVQRLSALGYQPAHRFCASNLYPRRIPISPVCYTFYEPSPSAAMAGKP